MHFSGLQLDEQARKDAEAAAKGTVKYRVNKAALKKRQELRRKAATDKP